MYFLCPPKIERITIKNILNYGTSVLLIIGATIYFYLNPIPQAHVLSWSNLIVRWVHMIFGIAWIGASFYFVFLENALNRTDGIRDELAGNLWAIHGGGFYFLEKYKIAPKQIPTDLHWFKYEAYFTWITGVGLLFIVYYLNAEAYLIDATKSDISPMTAIAIGIGSMVGSWFFYDLLSRTPLLKKKVVFFIIMFAFISLMAFGLTQVFTGRGAFIHVGAIIGTMMVGNVFFVIIPGQKAMVEAAKKGESPDPWLGQFAQFRSYHNNYFTFPILFIMISSHFPETYGNGLNWAILILLSISSIGIKHFINLLDKGETKFWLIPLSVLGLLILIGYTAPKKAEVNVYTETVAFNEIQSIIETRCQSCHSANSTDDMFTVAPAGVMFDTKDQIISRLDRIKVRAVDTGTMPFQNKTAMTELERSKLLAWFDQGAKTD